MIFSATCGASTIRIGEQTALVIGCRGLNDYELNGDIDELRMYDHVLSAQEIADLEK